LTDLAEVRELSLTELVEALELSLTETPGVQPSLKFALALRW
jgi:hypothetical protein